MICSKRHVTKLVKYFTLLNPGFANGELGNLPTDRDFQIRTPNAKAALVEDAGQRALRIDATFNGAKESDNFPIVVSHEIELKLGAQYLLRARLRTDRKESDKGYATGAVLRRAEGGKARPFPGQFTIHGRGRARVEGL